MTISVQIRLLQFGRVIAENVHFVNDPINVELPDFVIDGSIQFYGYQFLPKVRHIAAFNAQYIDSSAANRTAEESTEKIPAPTDNALHIVANLSANIMSSLAAALERYPGNVTRTAAIAAILQETAKDLRDTFNRA